MRSDYIELKAGIALVLDYRGKTPKKLGSDWVERGVRVVSAKNVHNGVLDNLDDIRCVTFDVYKKWMKEEIKRNDILLASEGASMGESMIWESNEKIVLGQRLFGLRCDENVLDPFYLAMYIRTPEYRAELENHATGTSVLGLRQPALLSTKIRYIPLVEQKRIGQLYKALNARIENNKHINDNLQQQASAIYKSWFVDYSPFDGVEPEEWGNVILEDITSLVIRGIAPKYSDVSDQTVINQKCIRNHMIDLSLARTHTPKVINEKWLRFGDLLINSTGDGTLGRTAQVWFQPKNLTVDSHVTIVRPAKENLIFYVGLWGILHEREIESLHTGSTGQTELPRDRVKAMELVLPDNETLDRFNALIAPMAATIVSNQEENNRLAALRDALLPKLMSGEIDVSEVKI